MDIFLHSNQPITITCSPFAFESYVAAFLGEGGKIRQSNFTETGWDLAIEVFGDRSEVKLREFAAFLKRFDVPRDTKLRYVVRDGSDRTIVVHESQA